MVALVLASAIVPLDVGVGVEFEDNGEIADELSAGSAESDTVAEVLMGAGGASFPVRSVPVRLIF